MTLQMRAKPHDSVRPCLRLVALPPGLFLISAAGARTIAAMRATDSRCSMSNVARWAMAPQKGSQTRSQIRSPESSATPSDVQTVQVVVLIVVIALAPSTGMAATAATP
jgi:hypothetical protein